MLFCLIAAVTAALFLLVKVIMLKRSAREITNQVEQKLGTETNMLIGISSSDRDMRKLAAELNRQLKALRDQQIRYDHGDTELKNAVTNISHDLRTPLTAIASYIELLEKTDDREKKERYIGIIKERAEALNQLTEELFRYSVIVTSDAEESTEQISVGAVLEDCVLGLYAALSEQGIVPEIKITEAPVMRKVSCADLSRVFSNLLNNALKYSSGDLKITLTESGEITFANHAPEMSKVQAERLFDRFYTLENARRSTGLGLSIARVLIGQMNGTINAEYNDGMLIIRIILPKEK